MGAFLIQVLFAHERVPKTSGSVNILGSETLKCHQSVDPDIKHKHFMCVHVKLSDCTVLYLHILDLSQ